MSRLRAVQVLVFALALSGGACRPGPTLDLGDDLRDASATRGDGAIEQSDGGTPDADPVSSDGGEGDGEVPRACTTNLECEPGARSRCHDDVCVECIEASDCKDPERPHCVEGDCAEEEEPACVEDDSCGCLSSADCIDPEKPFCVAARCVKCTQDADCADEGLGVCDLSEGQCE